MQHFKSERRASGYNVGSGVLPVGACGGHTAGHGSAGRVGTSPLSSHVPKHLIRFTSNSAAGVSRCSLSLTYK